LVERPYMYLIKYIFVNIVYHSYRILFIAVSIKNIVDISSNKQFAQPRCYNKDAICYTLWGRICKHGTNGVDTMTSALQNISNFNHFPLL